MIPQYLSTIWDAVAPAMANHLWQSTWCAAVAGILAWVLHKNHAYIRYQLWLAASVKFLIPFSLLVSISSHFAKSFNQPETRSGFYAAIEQVSQPFPQQTISLVAPVTSSTAHETFISLLLPGFLLVVWLCGFVLVLSRGCVRWLSISAIRQKASPLLEGREVKLLRHVETVVGVRKPIELRLSQASLEPGIFGIFRPTLLWPARISNLFEDAHLRAILAHEVWHVRRRDNLAALVHMVVEAVFWFHPLVWWLGKQLVEERERSCDEKVLQLGNDPQIYAESILETCKFCMESPLTCMSGVTGAELKRRIVRIMARHLGEKLGLRGKLLLSVACLAAVGGPLAFGLMYVPHFHAQLLQETSSPLPSFEVATIKPTRPEDNSQRIMMSHGRFTVENQALSEIIKFAYNITSEDQLSGGPSWIRSEKYDIDAKEEAALVQKLKNLPREQMADQVRLMVQSLLADRFKLEVSRQTRELPVYALVIAKGGPKLTQSAPVSSMSKLSGPKMTGIRSTGRGQLSANNAPFKLILDVLSRQPEIGGRTIVDETGLQGDYDWSLNWSPERPDQFNGGNSGQESATAPAPDSSAPSLFTALREQLGLRLQPQKGSVEVLLIDHIEKPSEN
jgi:bla regulator protein blaR1